MLWGETNPSGMLPFTVHPEGFVNETSMLDMSMRAGSGRTYRFLRSPPLWPFGWSLSFTTFTTEWATQPVATAATADPTMAFSVKVTNTGNVGDFGVVFCFWFSTISHVFLRLRVTPHVSCGALFAVPVRVTC